MSVMVIKGGPIPDPSSITFNPVLTGMLLNSARNFRAAANVAIPRRGFDKHTVEIPKVSEKALYGNTLQTRGMTAQAKAAHRIGFQMDSNFTFEMPWADGTMQIDDNTTRIWGASMSPASLEAMKRKTMLAALMNTEEAEFVASAWLTSAWTTSYASGTVDKWSDMSSDPVDQVNTARSQILLKSGMDANAMIMPRAVYNALTIHPRIRERISGGQGGASNQLVKKADIAALFELQELHVVDYAYNQAATLEATLDMQYTVTDGVLFFHRATGMDDDQPVVGDAIIRAGWRGTGSDDGVLVNNGRNEEGRYEWRYLGRCAKYVIPNPGAGAFWEDVV